MENLKIALVKQEVYQDLYVCSKDEKSSLKVLFSSMGRVGPIGLIEELGADFLIVKEELYKETQVYKKVIPHISEHLQMLKTETLDKLPNQGFKRPGSPYSNGKFSINSNDVDWGKYDIVISINVSIPKNIIKNYENTLFCYMIGEANMASRWVRFGYDVALNQKSSGRIARKTGVVDFPYTFVKGDTLEKILLQRYPIPRKKGIYIEVNCSKERPVKQIPEQFDKVKKETNEEMLLHKQLIEDNLLSIYQARYYVKIGGRKTRGNGAIEAISLGTLVIMNPSDVIHREILPKETQCRNADQVIELINNLNSNEGQQL